MHVRRFIDTWTCNMCNLPDVFTLLIHLSMSLFKTCNGTAPLPSTTEWKSLISYNGPEKTNILLEASGQIDILFHTYINIYNITWPTWDHWPDTLECITRCVELLNKYVSLFVHDISQYVRVTHVHCVHML